LSCLKSHGVKFVIVGAHALAVAGLARPTRDIDVLVEPSKANAKRLARALSEFGFPEMAQAAEAHFAVRDRMATLGREPLRIDILSSISGVSFAAAWKGRSRVVVDGTELPFLSLTDLRRAKRAAARPKDIDDLHRIDELLGRQSRTKPRTRPGTRATKRSKKRS
jgi:predicted nucleotidyltransferase